MRDYKICVSKMNSKFLIFQTYIVYFILEIVIFILLQTNIAFLFVFILLRIFITLYFFKSQILRKVYNKWLIVNTEILYLFFLTVQIGLLAFFRNLSITVMIFIYVQIEFIMIFLVFFH